MIQTTPKLRVGAVSYLNTVPLVWGMLHGEQQSQVDLSFSIPSLCAASVEAGSIDVGLVPVAEIARQNLAILADVGIAAVGPVRSILLVSRVPFSKIRTLAVDLSSRTSVQLARVILRERYGVVPRLAAEEPILGQMLAGSEAALVIGDPALRIDPATLPFQCLDLAEEWHVLTGLPMVFAAWAGQPHVTNRGFADIARNSYADGRDHLPEIVESQFELRGITRVLATEYLNRYIKYSLGPAEREGLQTFLELAELIPSRSIAS